MRKQDRLSSGPKIIVDLFTRREVEVLRLICKQYSNQEMADKLGLSKRTIEDLRRRVIKKTKSKNAVGIVLYALRHKMIRL